MHELTKVYTYIDHSFILFSYVTVDVAQSLMYVGGVHAIIGTMEKFPNNLEVIENGCRTLGCFAMHGNYLGHFIYSTTFVSKSSQMTKMDIWSLQPISACHLFLGIVSFKYKCLPFRSI